MIPIEKYLEGILVDFKEYLSGEPELCDLKQLQFATNALPSYNNIHLQQYYLLRFGFAYAFEYKKMYMHLLNKMEYDTQVDILSIGCGNLVDYWAAASALEMNIFNTCKIKYKGIDLVDWKYKFEPRLVDDVEVEKADAIEWLTCLEQLNYDVIIFPKSISEFGEDRFQEMCDILGKIDNKKNKLHIMASLRTDSELRKEDYSRVKQLVKALCTNGYSINDKDIKNSWKASDGDKGIRSYDSSFIYPDEAKPIITELYKLCRTFIEFGENCEDECVEILSRWPILKAAKLRYMIVSFERE